jgi:VCBS repeat-containing protein
VEVSGTNFGELELEVPTSVNLIAVSDTGLENNDDLTKLNNADADSRLQFQVTGVTDGATVSIYCDGVKIGEGTASGGTVTITTDGETDIADGAHSFTATQSIGGFESDASDALTVTIDTTPPAAIASTASELAQILVEYTFDADSPDEGETGVRYSLVNPPSGMTIDELTGQISWTPTADQDVPQLFDIVVSDAAGNTSVQTVDMTVLGVIPAYPDSYTVEEDAVLTVGAGEGVLHNDDNASTLTASLVDGPEHGTVTLNADGSFTYTPDEDFYGTDSFTYEATDGTDTTNVAKVTIKVTDTPDPPVGEEDSYSTDEDTVLTVNAAEGVLANDTDPDDDDLTATLGTGPTHGTLTLNADGSFEYTPNENYHGTDSFTYILSDGTDSTDPITVEITVNEIDDPPVPEEDSYTTDEDVVLTVNAANGVLANDTDVDSSNLTAAIVDQPDHGSITWNANGSFTYTPDENYHGTDTFTYTVSDGTTTSAETTVTITVESANDDPVADDDAYDAANGGKTHVFNVVSNDSDSDGDDFNIIAVTQGNHGGVIAFGADNKILYTADTDYTGTETFTYTIEDEYGNTDTATVTVTVTDGGGETGDSKITGYVFIDTDNDGERDSGEIGVPGALITLTGTSDGGNSVSKTCLTDDNGYFVFTDIPAGTYTLTETQPKVVSDGLDSATASEADVSNDTIKDLDLDDNETIDGNHFGERALRSKYVTLHMFLASRPPIDEYLRELVAHGEQLAGNSDLAQAIRDGETDYEPEDGNHAPVAQADSYSTEENTKLTTSASSGVLANDSDADDDSLTMALVQTTSHGTLTFNANGSFEYTPNTNYTGTDTFKYLVYDGETVSGIVTVTITVSEGDDAPVAQDDEYTVSEDGELDVDAADGVLKNDTDAENDSLEAVLVEGPAHGNLDLNADGSFKYTPDDDYEGTDTFTYYATDGEHNSETVTVTITVKGANDPPAATEDEYTVSENTTLTINAANGVLDNDSDPDGDDLTADLVADPTNGTVTLNADGSFTYIPNVNYTGTDTFTYRAYDGTAYSSTVTVTITVSEGNDAPVGQDDSYEVNEDSILTIAAAEGVLANDSDADNDSLEAVIVSQPSNGSVTLNADGSFEYTPNENYVGTDTFTYKVTDGTLSSEEITVEIEVLQVNDAPEGADDVYMVIPNGELTIAAAEGVLANDTDIEDDSLTAVLVTDVQHGTLTLNSDGSFTYEPDDDYHGIDSFTYKANDGELDSEEITVEIHVNTPAVTEDDAYEVDEDGELNVYVAGGVLANDSDPDNDSLTVAIVTQPAHGTLTLNENGSFTYKPNANFHGTDTFTYVANDGYTEASTATVTITVKPVNDAPLAAADEYTASENTTLTINADNGVLKNDSDIDGDTIKAVLVAQPQNGTVTLNEDGSFEYTPGPNFVGTDSFVYQADDESLLSSVVTVTITVEEGNDIPLAAADEYSIEVNGTLIVEVAAGLLANDTDDDGDSLTVTIVTQPTHGTLTPSENGDGSFTYTPNADFHGTDEFTYTVSDGTFTSEPVVVRIDVNDPVDADDDVYSVDEDTTLNVEVGDGVLKNDSDPNGDQIKVEVVTGPEHGTVELDEDGSFVYIPNADFSGTDTFTYVAKDGYLNATEATVTITVNPINDAPVGEEDSYTVAVDSSEVNVSAAEGVLANDSDADAGDTLTVEKVADVEHGTLTLYTDGSFDYTPTAGYHGKDTFTYKINDGTVDSGEITVTINVNSHADAVNDTGYQVDEDGKLEVVDAPSGVLGNDSDPDGDNLTATVVVEPEHGEVTLNLDGTFTYTPDEDFHGTDSFTYAALDGYDNPSEATVTITVNPVNDAPVGVEDVYSVLPDGELDIDAASGVLANDTDVDGDTTLTAELVDNVQHGELTLLANGSFEYEPTEGYHGEDTFTYKVSDGTEESEVVTVTINVNTPPTGVEDVYTVLPDGELEIDAASGVLANDTDADGDTSFTATLVDDVEHGTLTLYEDGSFDYEPTEGYHGHDTFTYTVSDGMDESELVTVTIDVNTPAEAEADSYDVEKNATLTIAAVDGVLANDSDDDDDDLSAVVLEGPLHGELKLNADGSFTYTPDEGYTGTDSFTYVAEDGYAEPSEATVTIAVDEALGAEETWV